MENVQVAVIGAGPIGIEVAAMLKRNHLSYIHFERGQIGDTLHRRWPPGARFFSSPERVAIAGIPIQTVTQEMVPREEYLAYLRGVVEILDLQIYTYHNVIAIRKSGEKFAMTAQSNTGSTQILSDYVVLATGDMAYPTRLGVPGEDLPNVHHVMKEPHEYYGKRLLIVGSRNSAVENAIRCWRSGAQVTLSVRSKKLDRSRLNSRLGLEIGILIEKHRISLIAGHEVAEITGSKVVLKDHETGDKKVVATDFVIVNAGFQADLSLMKMAGVELEGDEEIPHFNPATMESNIPGIYLAGTASGGNKESYKIFIGTSHGHGPAILKSITGICSDLSGTIEARRYPFSIDDIESKDM